MTNVTATQLGIIKSAVTKHHSFIIFLHFALKLSQYLFCEQFSKLCESDMIDKCLMIIG